MLHLKGSMLLVCHTTPIALLIVKIEIMQLDSDYAIPMVVVRPTVELGIK